MNETNIAIRRIIKQRCIPVRRTKICRTQSKKLLNKKYMCETCWICFIFAIKRLPAFYFDIFTRP